jgi:hypothetical protein
MTNSLLIDYIKIFDIDLDPNLLNKIESISNFFNPAMTGSGDKEYRRCKDLWINEQVVTELGLPSVFCEIYGSLKTGVDQSLELYSLEFSNAKESVLKEYQGLHILRYDLGDNYKIHVDDFGKHAFRRLSVSIQLNDDFVGGEFEFFGSAKYQLKKNQAIVFPSNWMYPHRITPITHGTRWSTVTWAV